jgi:hypothetical protein
MLAEVLSINASWASADNFERQRWMRRNDGIGSSNVQHIFIN